MISSGELIDADGTPVGRLRCDCDMERHMSELGKWRLIRIATLGVSLLFYSFRAGRAALDATRVEWYRAGWTQQFRRGLLTATAKS